MEEEEEEEEVDEEGSTTLAGGRRRRAHCHINLLVLLCIVSRFFILTSIMCSRSKDNILLRGWGTNATFASKCICIPYNHTVDLHKVKCISQFVQGLHAQALAIAPQQILVGSSGQFVKMTETSLSWTLQTNSVVHSLLP